MYNASTSIEMVSKMNNLGVVFSNYSNEKFVSDKIRELTKKKVITQTMALHYEMMLKNRDYFNEQVFKKAKLYDNTTPFKNKITASERFAGLIPLPTVFGMGLFSFQSPFHVAMDILMLSGIFLEGRSIDIVTNEAKAIADALVEMHGNPAMLKTINDFWGSPATVLAELKIVGQKSLCMDHFKVSKTVSDLMSITKITDKVPSKMVIPTRAMTLIEVPADSGLRLFNAATGWHDLETITIFRDDHEAHSGATRHYSPKMIESAGITEETPFTRICFYFNGKPHEGDRYFDDATMFINVLIKDLERSLIDSITSALLDDYEIDKNMLALMMEAESGVELMEYEDDRRSQDTIALVRYAASILLFVNSNYARKEFVSTVVDQGPMPPLNKTNPKKLGVKIQKEAALPSFTRLHFHSNESDQASVKQYLNDSPTDKRKVSPHWRGPHWRGQHYGAENKLMKLVFIAPVFVGAKNLGEVLPGRRNTI